MGCQDPVREIGVTVHLSIDMKTTLCRAVLGGGTFPLYFVLLHGRSCLLVMPVTPVSAARIDDSAVLPRTFDSCRSFLCFDVSWNGLTFSLIPHFPSSLLPRSYNLGKPLLSP